MRILVTGVNGRLGAQIVGDFKSASLDVVEYSHTMSLDSVNWEDIDTVINCAAATPAPSTSVEMYLKANVHFIERILPYVVGKNFIHFSTFSELYRDSPYQRSKMLGTSILLVNAGKFRHLSILPLPTLDDIPLIERICSLALKDEMPSVDRLTYYSMTYQSVAQYVKQLVSGETNDHITSKYQVKNLYAEVTSRVPSSKVIIGKEIDRTLLVNGIHRSSPDINFLKRDLC